MAFLGTGPTELAGLSIEATSIAGNVFWVDSGAGSNANPGTRTSPFATLDYAVGQCVADNGDVIYLKPGHAETLTAAAAVDLDVAGISVIGLGNGSNMATFTFTTATTADIDVDAANVTIKNCRFVCDIDAQVAAIDVNAAYCTIDGCEFIDNGTDNCLIWILGVAAASDMRVLNCVNKGTATAGNQAFIQLAAQDHCVIKNCVSEGDFSLANIDCSAAPTDVLIEGNRLENANAVDVCIEGFAAATGWVVGNMLRIATDAQVTGINTVGALSLFENYQVNNDGETGILVGTPSV